MTPKTQLTALIARSATAFMFLLLASRVQGGFAVADASQDCCEAGRAVVAEIGLSRLARSLTLTTDVPRDRPNHPAPSIKRRRAALVLAFLAARTGAAKGPLEHRDAAPMVVEAPTGSGSPAAVALVPLPPPRAVPPRPGAEATGIPIDDGIRTLPVAGRVVHDFGTPVADGGMRRGITYRTSSGAPVRAPAAGRIAFAGRFRGYGLVLIVEHADGYHSLLTGLGRIDTHIGQRVGASEPVGAAESVGDRDPQMYFELRRDGRPVDPMPWLTSNKGKVRG